MPLTPAKKHFQKACAEAESALAAENNALLEDATGYELMLAQLAQHQRQLKQTQSIERRAEIKKEKILPEYIPYVDGVLESNAGVQDDVLMTVMAWRIDAGDLQGAIQIAGYALEHNLVMPDRFNRDTATFFAEDISELIIADHSDAESSILVMDEVFELVRDSDMPDQVRAKVHKALGLSLETIDPGHALINLDRALELNKQAGVKKLADKLRKQLAPSN